MTPPPKELPKIDTADVRFDLNIGGRCRRSLIRHYLEWLLSEIEARGVKLARDPLLLNQDFIEHQAWRLTDNTIERLRNEFRDDVDLGSGANGDPADYTPEGTSRDYADDALPAIIEGEKRQFLADEIFGIAKLIEAASGASGHGVGPGYSDDGSRA